MDVIEENHVWNSIEDESADQSFFREAPGICDAFRDPELLPHIGNEFQVEIPAYITECAYRLLTESPTDATILPGGYHEFLVGLPLPLMWISEVVGKIKHEQQFHAGEWTGVSNRIESEKSESIGGEMEIVPEGDLKDKVEPLDIPLNDGTGIGESAELCLQQEINNEMWQKRGGKGYCLVPGSMCNPWSDAEEDSFLLGLYIFGKNLAQVKNFVESKTMGDILSFYYGKFYGSDKYRKWSECRKIRSRKCVYGQRIFTGSRQQELLSRLLLQVSEDRKNILLEAAKTFGEGKMCLEEYVFMLKSMVGLNALVEAVGIGKWKQDLTGIAMEPPKSNQVAPVRPEVPIGKACSTLSPVEIINFLTGGYRISKARSNDLFWEAVWPRLLARGWHSEQPKDHSFAAASRHSLVFLIPGIKKFSRRKLVKGDHYFDSVLDVLNKVASDPTLLELDIGEDKGGSKEENGWTNETNLDQGDFPGQRRHCYLKPRTPSHSSNVMKFTVVDTSLANGDATMLRELRSLPAELMNISTYRSDSEDSDGDSSEESTEESDSADTSCFDRIKTDLTKSAETNLDKEGSSDREDFENNDLKQSVPVNGSGFTKVPAKIPKIQIADKCDDNKTRKPIKGQATRRVRTGDRKLLASVAKTQQLIACDSTETSHVTIDCPRLNKVEAGCTGDGPDFREDILSRVDPPVEKFSATSSSSRGSANDSDECILSRNSCRIEHPCAQLLQSRTLFDLNIPISQDAEMEPVMMAVTRVQDDQASRSTDDSGMQKTSTSVCDSTLERPLASRRHSTRNRPPTTKALEALACGFLSIKQKRKTRDDFPLENRMSRPSRRARSKMRITESFSEDFKGDERGNGGCKSNGDMLNELQV